MDYSQGLVEWNMASFINMELADINRRANASYISGEYIKALDCQKAKRMTAGYSFSKEERAALDEMEKGFDSVVVLIPLVHSWNKEHKQKAMQAIMVFKKLYAKYVEKLNDTLDAHGWYGARKKDASRMNI